MDFKKLQEEINGMAAEDLTEVAYKNFYSIVNFLNEMEGLNAREAEITLEGKINTTVYYAELNFRNVDTRLCVENIDHGMESCFDINLDDIQKIEKTPAGDYNIIMPGQEISILFAW
jgi:hypothetical protein